MQKRLQHGHPFRRPVRPSVSGSSRRLLSLCTLLVLVLVLMHQARNPQHWTWISTWPADVASERRAPDPAQGRPTAAATDSSRPETASHGAPAAEPVDSMPNALLPPDLLARIRDDTYFRAEETAAWFHVWRLLHGVDERQWTRHALGPVGPLQLVRQTALYRGKVVRVEGIVRRAHRLAAPENDAGIQRYWQCWLQSHRSASRPIVVYALEMPAGFPQGMELDEPIWFVGVYFKRWAYPAAQGTMVAPVVLAKKGFQAGGHRTDGTNGADGT